MDRKTITPYRAPPSTFVAAKGGMPQETGLRPGEPRWPALLAFLAIGGLYCALPRSLTLGPNWLALIFVAVLATPAVLFNGVVSQRTRLIFGYAANAVVTVSTIASLLLLISRLPEHKESPPELLISAGALWICNVLVFACWYWRLDAGGPHRRDLQNSHTDGAFLFPQMALDPQLRHEMGEEQWRPGFVDYLFLAKHNTAFSPTDVPCFALGQGSDDGSGDHLACHGRTASRARREHSLTASILTQVEPGLTVGAIELCSDDLNLKPGAEEIVRVASLEPATET